MGKYTGSVLSLEQQQNLAIRILGQKYQTDFTLDQLPALYQAFQAFDQLYDDVIDLRPHASLEESTQAVYRLEFENSVYKQLFDPFVNKDGKGVISFDLVKAQQNWPAVITTLRRQRPQLAEVHATSSNLSLAAKLIKKKLGSQEWLNDHDLHTALQGLGLQDKVTVTRLQPEDIGYLLHEARIKHRGSAPYTVRLLVNVGLGEFSQGSHWAWVKFTVDSTQKTVKVFYQDSLRDADGDKARITKARLQQAVQYEETITRQQVKQTFSAFPTGYKVDYWVDFTGEQTHAREGWSCGYRAIKSVTTDIDPNNSLAKTKTITETRDLIYQTVIGETKFNKQEFSEQLKLQPTLYQENKDGTVSLTSEGTSKLLNYFRKQQAAKTFRYQPSPELQVQRFMREINKADEIKNLSDLEQAEYVLDIKQLFDEKLKQLLKEGDNELYVKCALVKSILSALAKSKKIKKLTINSLDKVDEKVKQVIVAKLSNVGNFIEFESDSAELKELGKQVAVKNRINAIAAAGVFDHLTVVKDIKANATGDVSLDLDAIFSDAKFIKLIKNPKENDIYQQALIRATLIAVANNKAIKKLIVNGKNAKEELTAFFAENFSTLANITEFESDSKALETACHPVALRNRMLAIYKPDLQEVTDLWNVAMREFFEDNVAFVSTETFAILRAAGSEDEDINNRTNALRDCIVGMGVIGIREMLRFLSKNQESLRAAGTAYNRFEIKYLVVSRELELTPEVISEFVAYFKDKESHYFPFRRLTFYFKDFAKDSLESLVQLISVLNNTNLEKVEIFGSEYLKFNKEEIAKLVVAAKNSKLTVSLEMRESQDPEINMQLQELKNVIAKNRRELNKDKRRNLLKARNEAVELFLEIEPTTKAATVTAAKPSPVVTKSSKGMQKVRRAKLAFDPSSLNTEVQVEQEQEKQVQQQQQQQIETQQARQALIEQLRERQEGKTGLVIEPFSGKEALKRKGFSENLLIRQHADVFLPTELAANLPIVWNELFGSHDFLSENIHAVTVEAGIAAVKYYKYYLRGGFNLENLPSGFFMQRDGKNLVLCYDQYHITENPNQSPLTIVYPEKLERTTWVGDANQFDAMPTITAQISFNGPFPGDVYFGSSSRLSLQKMRDNLYEYMVAEDKKLAEKLMKKYADILELLSQDNITGLAEVLMQEGCVGVEAVVKNLKKIKDKHGADYFSSFQYAFMDTSRSLMNFLEDDAFSAVDVLLDFSPEQLSWWQALSEQHVAEAGWASLPDLVFAFQEFCNRLAQFVPPVNLEMPCPLTGEPHDLEILLDADSSEINNWQKKNQNTKNILFYTEKGTGDFYWIYKKGRRTYKDKLDKYKGLGRAFKKLIATGISESQRKKIQGMVITSIGYDRPIKNMKVSLERILTLLDNAVNPQEQLRYLAGVSVAADGAPYASVHENYHLVTEEMQLKPLALMKASSEGFVFINEEEFKGGKVRTIEKAEAGYRADYATLKESALNRKVPINVLVIQFYRYLGRQLEIADFDDYKVLAKKITETSLSDSHKKKILAILAYATTGSRGYVTDFTAESAVLLKAINTLDSGKKDAVLSALVAWGDLEVAPTAAEVADLAVVLGRLDLEEIPEAATRLHDYAAAHKGKFYQAIMTYATNDTPLPLKLFSNYLRKTPAEFAAKMIVVLAAVASDPNYVEASFDNFLAILQQVGSAKTDALLDVLVLIDTEQSIELPIITALETILVKVQQLDIVSDPDIMAIVQQQIPGCVFKASKSRLPVKIELSETLDDEVIEEILALAKTLHLTSKIDETELRGPNGASYLIEIYSQYKNIPGVKKAFISAVRKKHESEVLSQATTILANTPLLAPFETLVKSKLNAELFKLKGEDAAKEIQGLVQQRTEDLTKFSVLLAKIDRKWPGQAQQLLELLLTNSSVEKFNISGLYNFLNRVNLYSKGSDLQLDLVRLLLEHKSVSKLTTATRRGFEASLLVNLEIIHNIADITTAQGHLLFKLTLDNPDFKIAQLQEIKDKYSENFAYTIKILTIDPARIAECLVAIKAVLTDLTDKQLQTEFFIIMAEHPADFMALNTVMQDATSALIPQILKIVTYTAADEYDKDKIIELIDLLKTLNQIDINQLANLYNYRPFPSVNKIIGELKKTDFSIEKFVVELEKDPHGQRTNADDIARQFDTSQVARVINGLQNLATGNSLFYSQKQRLQQWMTYINAIGHSHPVDTDFKKPIMALNGNEIHQALNKYKAILNNSKESPQAILQAQLTIVALLREIMYRTTGKLPYTTQIISLLNTMMHGGNVISEIQTGQGKGLTTALFSASLWLRGQAVDVCTSNRELARRDLEEFQDFYHYLGVDTSLIDAGSAAEAYQVGGINYSDVANLSLYRSRMHFEGNEFPEKASLVLDEADYTVLDDTTQFRFATNLDPTSKPFENKFAWVYPLLNNFIETESFKDASEETGWSREQDCINARHYLRQHADSQYHDMLGEITNKQLDVWLDSAIAASHLEVGIHFAIRQEQHGAAGEGHQVAMARLIVNKRVSPNAQWSNGVQQFLHARLNALRRAIPEFSPNEFLIDPEKSYLASTSAKNFVDYYLARGNIWGMTGTIGSERERLEQREKYGFKQFQVPPHQNQIRRALRPIVVKDRNHNKTIFAEILKRLRRSPPMPMLIVTENAPAAQALHEYINAQLNKKRKYKNYEKLQLYDGTQTDITEAEVVERAGTAGCITITTPILGRGTDIKPVMPDRLTKHPHGLFVMQTYIDEERSHRQVIGRSGRQGMVGETLLLVKRSAFKLLKKIKPKKQFSAAQQKLRERLNKDKEGKRLLGEAFADVRNQIFEKYLVALDLVTTSEKAEVKNLVRVWQGAWANYLQDLDSEWIEILTGQETFDLPEAIEALAKFAVEKWHELNIHFSEKIKQLQKAKVEVEAYPTSKLKLNVEQVAKQALFNVTGKKELYFETQAESRVVTDEVNVDQIYAEIAGEKATKLKVETGVSLQFGERAIQHALQKHIALLNRNLGFNNIHRSLQGIDLSRDIYEYNMQDFVISIIKTLLHLYLKESTDPGLHPNTQYMKSYRELIVLIGNMGSEKLKAAVINVHSEHFTTLLMTHRPGLGIYLQDLNRLVAKTPFIAEAYQDREISALGVFKTQAMQALSAYLKNKWLASDRKINANNLKKAINSAPDIGTALAKLNEARQKALKIDWKTDQEATFFKRNKNGSRYQDVIEDLHQRLVAVMTPIQRDELVHYEIADYRNILKALKERVVGDKQFNAVLDNINACFGVLNSDALKGKADPKVLEPQLQAILTLYETLQKQYGNGNKIKSSATKTVFKLLQAKATQIALYLEQSKELRTTAREPRLFQQAIKSALKLINPDYSHQIPEQQITKIISSMEYPELNGQEGLKPPAFLRELIGKKQQILEQIHASLLLLIGNATAEVKFIAFEIIKPQKVGYDYAFKLRLELHDGNRRRRVVTSILIDTKHKIIDCDWPEIEVDEREISKLDKASKILRNARKRLDEVKLFLPDVEEKDLDDYLNEKHQEFNRKLKAFNKDEVDFNVFLDKIVSGEVSFESISPQKSLK